EEPDVSRILKVVGANQLEELNDSFDHPLHSTAVEDYREEHSEKEPLSHVVLQRKRAERSEKMRLKMPEGVVRKFNITGPADGPLVESLAQGKLHESIKHAPELHNACHCSIVSVNRPSSVQLWCPKELKRSPRDITELDVVLAEFEKTAANYRQSIESKISRKAIGAFCAAFKDQVTDLITEVQELKNLKKKNAKVVADINKKRQRLMQVREEQTRAEPQLKKLQREYAEVQERKSSLKQAVQFLTDVKDLQHDYLDYREENPREKVVYGTSSLPALLVESRRILGAERHFQDINRKLEYALDVQRRKLSKK
ncbi:CENPU protein, partial [Alectura lathami]|nr:CENPU protein [Alectura lathami]